MSVKNDKINFKTPLELEKMLPEIEDVDEVLKHMPIIADTRCGIGFIRGKFLQRFANKKSYVFIYGLAGCLTVATFAYFNGTVSTLEKRFKIPSRNMGIIAAGNDMSTTLLTAILSYYAGKKHRPRWIAAGLYATALFCVLNVLPHIIFGPGEQALSLTKEYEGVLTVNSTLSEQERRRTTCLTSVPPNVDLCEVEEGNFLIQFIFLVAQFFAGFGQSLYYTVGIAYMDDNIQKSKAPALVSISHFLSKIGPAIGYTISSASLKLYISPELTPTIHNRDPRWLGAWWLGWLILGAGLFILGFFMMLFPRQLPRAVARKKIDAERKRREMKAFEKDKSLDDKVSFKDMWATFKRLFKNKIFMLNEIAGIFYFFGQIPYWTFSPKYIETQYKQSAAVASLMVGTVVLVFTAIGILLSGIIISRYKPKARSLALWNVIVGIISVSAFASNSYIGCAHSENSIIVNIPTTDSLNTCNSNCHCDFVKYSPVCGSDGNTYISACHAGCQVTEIFNKKKKFSECSCIINVSNFSHQNTIEDFQSNGYFGKHNDFNENEESQQLNTNEGTATPGSCPINCFNEFVLFIVIRCVVSLISSSGAAGNILVGVRCVEERDKSVSMGFGFMFLSLFAFVPSPIFFGMVFDYACVVWGKTCTGTGNCWLYDGVKLRYTFNMFAALFTLFGTLFDIGVWYNVKDLKIFDDEEEKPEIEPINSTLK